MSSELLELELSDVEELPDDEETDLRLRPLWRDEHLLFRCLRFWPYALLGEEGVAAWRAAESVSASSRARVMRSSFCRALMAARPAAPMAAPWGAGANLAIGGNRSPTCCGGCWCGCGWAGGRGLKSLKADG